MGGRTQDKDKIKDHTIFELRKKSKFKIQGSQFGHATVNLKRIREKMMNLFESLKQEVLTVDDLYGNRLITAAQAKSFNERSAGWIVPEETNEKGVSLANGLVSTLKKFRFRKLSAMEMRKAISKRRRGGT